MNDREIIEKLQAPQEETERCAAEITGLKPHVEITVHGNKLDAEQRFSLASEAALQKWSINQGSGRPEICWVKDPSNRLTIFIDEKQYDTLVAARVSEANKAVVA